MRSLTERLYNDNVLFSYYGYVDSSVLAEVLRITRSKLESFSEPPALIERIHNAINDCVENIIEHNFFPEEDLLAYKSLIVVSGKSGSYFIDTINVINGHQKESIHQQLSNLSVKSKAELHDLKKQIILKNNHQSVAEGTGLGLIDLVLVSDNCNYRFKNYDTHFLFNINFEINSLN
ncbi:MAG: DUF6272 family protein [Bacteroidota bacterium]